jgi:putative SOS response-associated peptidase YedK
MCGRYTLSIPLSNLVDSFEVLPPQFEYRPRYNIAPTQDAPVIAQDDGGRRMGLLRWGLIPFWAKEPGIGNKMINARSETVAEKPAFRSAFKKRRCLVPADGFYEWKKEGGGEDGKVVKVPHWIHLKGREAFTFAGLWEKWSGEAEDPMYTFTILTTRAAATIEGIHPRMPVILPRKDGDRWLDPGTPPEELLALLRPYSGPDLKAHPVSTLVNSPRNDQADCIQPVSVR